MKNVILAAIAASICLSAGSASAATLTATTYALPPIGNNSFTIQFDDLNANSLFDFNELTSFSGFLSAFSTNVVSVLYVPTIAGFTVEGGAPGAYFYDSAWWNFEIDGLIDNSWDLAASTNNWTYEITGLAAVPLPASLPLLLAGLGLIGLMRRRPLR